MSGKPSKSKKPIQDRSSHRKRGPGIPLPVMPTRLPRLFESWKGSRRHLVVKDETQAPWDRRACGIVPNGDFGVIGVVEAPAFRDPRYCRPCFERYLADDEARRFKTARESKFQRVQDTFMGGFPIEGDLSPEANPARSKVG